MEASLHPGLEESQSTAPHLLHLLASVYFPQNLPPSSSHLPFPALLLQRTIRFTVSTSSSHCKAASCFSCSLSCHPNWRYNEQEGHSPGPHPTYNLKDKPALSYTIHPLINFYLSNFIPSSSHCPLISLAIIIHLFNGSSETFFYSPWWA